MERLGIFQGVPHILPNVHTVLAFLVFFSASVPKHYKSVLSFQRPPQSVVLLLGDRTSGDLFTDLKLLILLAAL